MMDDRGITIDPPPAVSSAWIITFSDLVSLLLAFFVMLYSVSARDPSKVDAAVSSMTEKFAKSSVISEFGTVASQTGVVVEDQEYLDSVISTIRGRDTMGEVKLLRSNSGTLMVRLSRSDIFVPRTGVLTPEGIALAQDIARAMVRRDVGETLPMVELRIVATPEEISDASASNGGEQPFIIRQVSRFARTLISENVSLQSISTVLLQGDVPTLDIAFYTLSDIERHPTAAGSVR